MVVGVPMHMKYAYFLTSTFGYRCMNPCQAGIQLRRPIEAHACVHAAILATLHGSRLMLVHVHHSDVH